MGNTTDKSGEELTNLPEGMGVVIKGVQPTKPKNPPHRPSEFTQEIADKLCEQITEGKSLRTICKADDMPSIATIFNWHRSQSGFLEQYTRAKEEQADTLSEDIQEIAVKTLKGEYDPQASRVAIDAYKWTASKLKPKKYGDKIDHTTNGKDLPTPILASLPPQNATDDVLDLT
jgi:hypothetical protein